MKRRMHRLGLPAIIIAVCVAALLAFMGIRGGKDIASKLIATPAPALNPLQIEAMRARTYPGDAITTTQILGDQGGYSDSIIRYSSDGLAQFARLSTPPGAAPASGWPVIMLLHGYVDPAAWRTDGPEYTSIMGELARSGYLVVRPDYRGHGQSEGAPSGGHFSPDYATDALNLLASLKQNSLVDASRIGVVGHSLGAHVAMRVMVVSPDVKATAMMSGVVGSISDILYNWPRSPMPQDRPIQSLTGIRQKLIAQYGDPRANPTFWDSVSAINYVTYTTGAVQIHHSVADSTVPKLFSDHLNEALTAAGKPVEYHAYPGDDHQLSLNRASVMQKMIFFYRTKL